MLYIVRRTQLYLDDEVWAALQVRARESGVTISELVRQAVRERYVGQSEERRRAMMAFASSRKDRTDQGETEPYLRALRKGKRLERFAG